MRPEVWRGESDTLQRVRLSETALKRCNGSCGEADSSLVEVQVLPWWVISSGGEARQGLVTEQLCKISLQIALT